MKHTHWLVAMHDGARHPLVLNGVPFRSSLALSTVFKFQSLRFAITLFLGFAASFNCRADFITYAYVGRPYDVISPVGDGVPISPLRLTLTYDQATNALVKWSTSFGPSISSEVGQLGFFNLAAHFVDLNDPNKGWFVESTPLLFAPAPSNDIFSIVTIKDDSQAGDLVGFSGANGGVRAYNQSQPGTWTTAADPPNLRQLALSSKAVYGPTPNNSAPVAGFTSIGTNADILPKQADNVSFHAAAFASPDNSQVVIAMRGTLLAEDQAVAGLKNLVNDTSFEAGAPTPLLEKDATYAAEFVAAIRDMPQFSNATITLTGHSYGGALAELVGTALAMPTTVFNAPGIGSLIDDLLPKLSQYSKGGLTFTPGMTNYRVYGDQVSLAGVPFGDVITLDNGPQHPIPDSRVGLNIFEQGSQFFENVLAYFDLHSIDTVFDQIDAAHLLSLGPDNLAFIRSAMTVVDTALVVKDAYDVLSGRMALVKLAELLLAKHLKMEVFQHGLNAIDPPGASHFILLADTGAPNMSSLALANYVGVDHYRLRYETDGIWSSFVNVTGGTELFFNSVVSGIEFLPVGADGRPVILHDALFFGIGFDQEGTFSATLFEGSASVPEPSSAVLLLGFTFAGAALWFARCRIEANRRVGEDRKQADQREVA